MNIFGKKKKSIRYTITASQISIIFIAVISFFVISSAYFTVKTKNDVKSDMLYSVNIASSNVYKYIREMENMLYSVSYNTDIIDILSKNSKSDIFERKKNTDDLTRNVSTILYNCSFPADVSFYICDSYKSFICDNSLFYDFDEIKDQEWLMKSMALGNSFYYFSERDEETEYISIANPLYYSYNLEKIAGYVKISADLSVIRELLINCSVKNARTLLLNSKGDIICDPYGYALSDDEKAEICAMSDGKISTKEISGGRCFIVKKASDNSHFCVLTLQSTSYMYHSLNYLLIILIIVLILVCIAGVAVSRMISKPVTEALDIMVDAMDNFKLGEINSIDIPDNLNFEVTNMMEAYNQMVQYIDNLIQYNNEYSKKLKKYEFDFIQMQIKPHFLYNTLNIMQYLTEEKQTDAAVQLIRALSKFYKISLHNKSEFVTIENEIMHIRYYVMIENFKYDNAFTLNVDVPEEIRKYSIPKITFQPLVENSIHHGILEKQIPTGTISITAQKSGEYVYIRIKDDGIGMTRDKIDEIMSGKTKSIGVRNTMERIRMCFGDESGFDIESVPDKYTVVTIKIKGVRFDDQYNDC